MRISDWSSDVCSSDLPKPSWLRVRIPAGERYQEVREIVQTHHLNTVCAASKCPNIAECWGRGTATLMLMGSVCTRACKFCAVNTGNRSEERRVGDACVSKCRDRVWQ